MLKLDKFSKHEFLDRTQIIANLFDTYIIQHVSFDNVPKKFKKKSEKAAELLWQLYQDSANLK